MAKALGRGMFHVEQNVYISSFAAVAGKKEGKAPSAGGSGQGASGH